MTFERYISPLNLPGKNRAKPFWVPNSLYLRLTYPGAHFTGTRYTPRRASHPFIPAKSFRGWERASPRAINSRNSCAGKIRRERTVAKISSENLTTNFSGVAQRAVYSLARLDMVRRGKNVAILPEDLSRSSNRAQRTKVKSAGSLSGEKEAENGDHCVQDG